MKVSKQINVRQNHCSFAWANEFARFMHFSLFARRSMYVYNILLCLFRVVIALSKRDNKYMETETKQQWKKKTVI